MAWFQRTAPVATSQRGTMPVRAAAAGTGAPGSLSWLAGNAVAGRTQAMTLPTISRARDLLASLIASCPVNRITQTWDQAAGQYSEQLQQPLPWQSQPNPGTTMAWQLAWTFDDLFFMGRSHWYIEARENGLATRFRLLPANMVTIQSPTWWGNAPIGGIQSIAFNGQLLEPRDVLSFWSPVESVLSAGRRALLTSERLDIAAFRFATVPMAQGWLRQTSGEPLSADELREIAEAWQAAREENSVGALNEFCEWNESNYDPARMQLIESRQHASLDLARIANVPAYLVGIATGGMTYTNAETARQDLYTFGALPYLACLEATLSGPQVCAPGTIVKLDHDQWVANMTQTPNEQVVSQ